MRRVVQSLPPGHDRNTSRPNSGHNCLSQRRRPSFNHTSSSRHNSTFSRNSSGFIRMPAAISRGFCRESPWRPRLSPPRFGHGLVDVIGSAGATNIQGEAVQKLDVLANQALLACLGNRGNVGVLASEENDEPAVVLSDPKYGKYVVIFDPLDGSSNIDVNVSVGTIFSIFRRDLESITKRDPADDVLQPGVKQIAAGYVLYGPSTLLVYSTGHGVHGFTLDPSFGAYIRTHSNITMPQTGPYYSVNEANLSSFPAGYQDFIGALRNGSSGRTYSSRYVGSLVADFHRTLVKGGIFCYPPTRRSMPQGKLRTDV